MVSVGEFALIFSVHVSTGCYLFLMNFLQQPHLAVGDDIGDNHLDTDQSDTEAAAGFPVVPTANVPAHNEA